MKSIFHHIIVIFCLTIGGTQKAFATPGIKKRYTEKEITLILLIEIISSLQRAMLVVVRFVSWNK